TCASCALTVEKAVGKLAGVDTSNVNLATEKLTVSYDAQSLYPSQIIEAVDKAGYKALSLASQEVAPAEDRQEKQIKNFWTRFIWSTVFTLPLLYIAMGP
ncbi:cation transporter, partial [Streptococcus pyogenes]